MNFNFKLCKKSYSWISNNKQFSIYHQQRFHFEEVLLDGVGAPAFCVTVVVGVNSCFGAVAVNRRPYNCHQNQSNHMTTFWPTTSSNWISWNSFAAAKRNKQRYKIDLSDSTVFTIKYYFILISSFISAFHSDLWIFPPYDDIVRNNKNNWRLNLSMKI